MRTYHPIQILVKACLVLAEYVRGTFLYCLVNLCGGKCVGVPRVSRGVVFKYAPHGGIHIGNKCFIGPNCTIDVPPGAELVIGDNVGFTAGVLLSSQKSICIGNDCLIAEWVSIRDAQHNFRVGTAIRLQGLSALPVVIESDVWIGRASCIIYGAVLQHGCVVGANSFVKGSTLDANGIYVGTPVRKSGSRS